MLSDTKARQAKPKERAYKLADEKGLYLAIMPRGTKSWRYDYRVHGRRETLTIGPYPEIALSEARDKLMLARKLVAKGESPAKKKSADKVAAKAARGNTVQAFAQSWFEELSKQRSAAWRVAATRWLEQDIYPALGNEPIAEVTLADVGELVRGIAKKRGPRSSHYARQVLSKVFRYARANGVQVGDPARDASDSVSVPAPVNHAPLAEKDIAAFVQAIEAKGGRPHTKLAAKLLLHTFVRKSELLGARWDEIDWDASLWRVPAARMKRNRDHLVPLSRQVLELLAELQPIACGSQYLFPSLSDLYKPMDASTLNVAFERMGYKGKLSPHGLRTTASTILNERGFTADAIERQLAHADENSIRAVYNKAEHLDVRKQMMQQWSDLLDVLCAASNVVPLQRSAA